MNNRLPLLHDFHDFPSRHKEITVHKQNVSFPAEGETQITPGPCHVTGKEIETKGLMCSLFVGRLNLFVAKS